VRFFRRKHDHATNADHPVVLPCSLARRRADELEVVRRRLGPPPDDHCSDPTTRIRIRLLSGTQVQRRFLASSSLQALFDFVDTSTAPPSDFVEAEVAEPTPYVLRLQFPVTEFMRPSSATEAPTLQALGLCPNALLLAEEQAMAAARTTDQVVLTSTQDSPSYSGTRDPSDQTVAAAAADVGRAATAEATVPEQAAPTPAGDHKRKRIAAADVSHRQQASKQAHFVDLLSSDDEDGVSTAAVAATDGCWACHVCTYAGNSAAAQRCQICDHARG
jgi:rubrerythrin